MDSAQQPNKSEILARHGIALEVFQQGVLIIGKSGIGKSELALDLIDRGHRLVADDLVNFSLNEQKLVIMGTANSGLHGFIEIRGLGFMDIKKLYGTKATCLACPLFVIIELIDNTPPSGYFDPLTQLIKQQQILDHSFPHYQLPIGMNRNLALLIELIVKYALAKDATDHDSHQKFIHQHQLQLENGNPKCKSS